LKKAALERAKKLLESQKKGVLDGIFKKPQPAKKDSTK
jgi:predicted kinase